MIKKIMSLFLSKQKETLAPATPEITKVSSLKIKLGQTIKITDQDCVTLTQEGWRRRERIWSQEPFFGVVVDRMIDKNKKECLRRTLLKVEKNGIRYNLWVNHNKSLSVVISK